MTYCVGLKLNRGLVFISDTLTNAGIDNINTNKKMFHWSEKNNKCIVLLTSGNLATSQATVNLINEGIKDQENADNDILKANSMFQVARIIGKVLRNISSEYATDGQAGENPYSSTFILGGQFKGQSHKLFLIYPEGNFIEASEDQPFFQIGETKYGKPILVRALEQDATFGDSIKLLLVSFDSTMKANVSVGMPIDICTLKKDQYQINKQIRIEKNDPYFQKISNEWGESLKKSIKELPSFNF